jgi:hypothetical protein
MYVPLSKFHAITLPSPGFHTEGYLTVSFEDSERSGDAFFIIVFLKFLGRNTLIDKVLCYFYKTKIFLKKEVKYRLNFIQKRLNNPYILSFFVPVCNCFHIPCFSEPHTCFS